MNLSRKWLTEFVDGVSVSDIDDREFSEAMTLSGSKVETYEDLGAEINNVLVGKILSMEKHPDSDHMWVCLIDVGQAEPVQIVTGAWNIHAGDLVPAALHNSLLPGGKKITKGKLRGVLSNGMLCSLKELDLDERDFPYGVISAAALLNDYHPLDKDKPSIPADIKAGDKVFGPVVAAAALPCVKFSPSIPAVWKFGRCLLASSHAGTRLPIAVIQNSGRSPSVRFSFPKDKKTKAPDPVPPLKNR